SLRVARAPLTFNIALFLHGTFCYLTSSVDFFFNHCSPSNRALSSVRTKTVYLFHGPVWTTTYHMADAQPVSGQIMDNLDHCEIHPAQ
ncbi:unnamed protein product, partial [Gulo gulo]